MGTKNSRWRLAQWLEVRWWQRYLSGKDPAKYLKDKRRYWKQVLDRLDWVVRPGTRALDAGCGPAGIFIEVANRQSVTAIDPLLTDYDRLSVFQRKSYPTVDFVPTTLEAFRSPTPFQQLYCLNAINHVADWEASLDTLTEVAAPDAELLLTSDVHRHRWLAAIFRRLPGDVLHPQQHRAEDYSNALTIRGWRIERQLVLRTELIFEYRAWVARR